MNGIDFSILINEKIHERALYSHLFSHFIELRGLTKIDEICIQTSKATFLQGK